MLSVAVAALLVEKLRSCSLQVVLGSCLFAC